MNKNNISFSKTVQLTIGLSGLMLVNNAYANFPSGNPQVLIGGASSSAGPVDRKKVRVLDGTDGLVLRNDEFSNNSNIFAVKFSPDGRFVASEGGANGVLEIFENDPSDTDLVILDSFFHQTTVRSVDWHPSGDFVAIGGFGGPSGFEVRVLPWDGADLDGPNVINFNNGTVGVFSISWSPEGDFLAIGDDGGIVKVLKFDGSSLTATGATFPHGADVFSVDWSPFGNFVAIGGSPGAADKEVRVLEFDGTSTLTQKTNFDHAPTAPINSVAWSPNRQFLAIGGFFGSGSKSLRVLEFTNNAPTTFALTQVGSGYATDGIVRSVAWYQDGQALAVGHDRSNNTTTLGLVFYPTSGIFSTPFFTQDHGNTVHSVDVFQEPFCDCPLGFSGACQCDLSCVTQDIGIDPNFQLKTNMITPVGEDCSENLCGTLKLKGCEVDISGRLVVRNIKVVLPDENGACECGLETGECRKNILNFSPSGNIEDLAALVIDLVGGMQEQQAELDIIRMTYDRRIEELSAQVTELAKN